MYLLVKQTMDEEDEGTLQAVDDGEQISHDTSYGADLEESQDPRTPQDEQLCKGLECQ